MRSDGHDRSRFAARRALPAIDHEAHGPLSALVRIGVWLAGRVRRPEMKRPASRRPVPAR